MMESTKWRFVFLVCAAVLLADVRASQSIMAKLSKGFVTVLKTCISELHFGEHIYKELYSFWKEEHELSDPDVGCVIICMASKLNLIGDDSKMHHGNAKEFAMNHGADEDMANQIVAMLHECEKVHAPDKDHCLRVLEMANCFRTKIHELKWAPNMEVVLEEIMTEVQL